MAKDKAPADNKEKDKNVEVAAETTDVTVPEKTSTVITENTLLSNLKGGDYDEFRVKDGNIKGLEAVDRSDLKIPVWQILQTNSELVLDEVEGAKAGLFYNSSSGGFASEIRAIFINMTKTRVRWPETYKSKSKAVCRSFNGIKGEGDPGMLCERCPFKEFGEGNKSPECKQGYNWLGLDLDNGLRPFRYTAISSGVAPTKVFLTDLVGTGFQMFVIEVVITTKKEKNDKGTFYVPSYKMKEQPIPKAIALQAMEVMESYKKMLEEDLRADIENTMAEEMEGEMVGEDGEQKVNKAF